MFVSGVCACANMDLNLLSESAMSQVFVKKNVSGENWMYHILDFHFVSSI